VNCFILTITSMAAVQKFETISDYFKSVYVYLSIERANRCDKCVCVRTNYHRYVLYEVLTCVRNVTPPFGYTSVC
jgi:hypothetical protein